MTGSLPVARHGEGEWVVTPDRHHLQHPEDVQGRTGSILREGLRSSVDFVFKAPRQETS